MDSFILSETGEAFTEPPQSQAEQGPFPRGAQPPAEKAAALDCTGKVSRTKPGSRRQKQTGRLQKQPEARSPPLSD